MLVANERLRHTLEAPGGMDDLDEEEEHDHDEASPSAAARAGDVEAKLTIGEIMELEPKRMVVNLTEKRINRYYATTNELSGRSKIPRHFSKPPR